MPSRYYTRIFVPNYYYHVYNRGANKSNIYRDAQDYSTFIDILSYYLIHPTGSALSAVNRKNNVENEPNKVPNLASTSSISLISFVLMPNHFHLIIKQNSSPEKDNNITNLMRRLTITYSMYYQKKYDHSGTLFQGKFKNVLVETDKQLLTLSKYLHTNPNELISPKPLKEYIYSSYPFYINNSSVIEWLNIQPILDFFNKKYPGIAYQAYVEHQDVHYEEIQGLVIDKD